VKMFEKILYPTDFSDVSKKALDYIEQLKEAGTKEVIVLHVIDGESGLLFGSRLEMLTRCYGALKQTG